MMLVPLFLVLQLLSFLNAQNQDNLNRCPTNLNRNQYLRTHGEYCYEFTVFRHNYWPSAQSRCARDGGFLAKIENMDQQKFLTDTLRELGFHERAIWIGLSDKAQEGSYIWTDGQPASFLYWGSGEPSFTHNFEDCVAMKPSDSGHWADYPCELPFLDDFSWICQYKMVPGVTVPPTAPPTVAPVQTYPTTEEPEVVFTSPGSVVVG